jgi:two-component system sensor histidine kinase UhpB
MILCWFVSNCTEALIGASLLRYLTDKSELRFDNTHHVSIFILVSLLGPFLSSFLDSAFVMLNHFGDTPYWAVFRMRFFSNVLASLTLVPLIVTWARGGLPSVRHTFWKGLETAALGAGLLIVGLISSRIRSAGQQTRPALLYLPLPLLLWAAIRFGPRGTTAALVIVSVFEIWGAIHGFGPFATQSAEMNALSVQMFLILASLPLMFLAALIKERERAQEVAGQKEQRLELALDSANQASRALSESQQKLHQSHNQIRKLLGRLIDVQEAERRRISRELHDDLNQKIATLSMNISQLKRNVPMPDGALISELDQLRETASGLTNEVRRLSHQLHPAVLEHLGLVKALESYIASFADEEQIDIRLSAELRDERIPFQTSIGLYRVAVEALRNVARHSGAKSAVVSLKRDSEFLELCVSDSGQGFDVERFRQGGGLGLISIEERLRLLQGSCEIFSTPGRGSMLVAKVPLR